VPADIASEIVKFTSSIPRESCTNAKAKYSSSVMPPDPSVHFYHWSPGKKVCPTARKNYFPCPVEKVYPVQKSFLIENSLRWQQTTLSVESLSRTTNIRRPTTSLEKEGMKVVT